MQGDAAVVTAELSSEGGSGRVVLAQPIQSQDATRSAREGSGEVGSKKAAAGGWGTDPGRLALLGGGGHPPAALSETLNGEISGM